MPRFSRCSGEAPASSWGQGHRWGESRASRGQVPPAVLLRHALDPQMCPSCAQIPQPHLVVDVEVPLSRVLAHDPRLLQQEVGDAAAVGLPALAELDLKVFALGRGAVSRDPTETQQCCRKVLRQQHPAQQRANSSPPPSAIRQAKTPGVCPQGSRELGAVRTPGLHPGGSSGYRLLPAPPLMAVPQFPHKMQASPMGVGQGGWTRKAPGSNVWGLAWRGAGGAGQGALTKRLELLLRTVLAFPKASSSGLDLRMMSLTCWRMGAPVRAPHSSPPGCPAPHPAHGGQPGDGRPGRRCLHACPHNAFQIHTPPRAQSVPHARQGTRPGPYTCQSTHCLSRVSPQNLLPGDRMAPGCYRAWEEPSLP